MSRKHHIILYALMGLTVLTAVLFGAEAALRARADRQALNDLQNRYALETREKLQNLTTQLAKAQVAADVRMQVELLSAVSREADGMVGALTALPLNHDAMNDTIRFCNQLSEYTLGLALLAASGDPLAQTEWEQLAQLRSQCTLLLGRLATYAPVELTAREDAPPLVYDGDYTDQPSPAAPRGLDQTQVDAHLALEIARSYVGEERVRSAVPGASAGGVLAAHGVTLTLRDGLVLNAEVTQQGGQLLWMMPEHAAFEEAISLEECLTRAQAFLQSRGYAPMELTHAQQYNGLAVLHFAALQQDVILYPDRLTLQLRMDTGEVVGLEAQQYLMNHEKRASLAPSLTLEQARARLSPQLALTSLRLCTIPDRHGELLCYEACGTANDQSYRVYLNAHTGAEEQVLLMVDGPNGYLAV